MHDLIKSVAANKIILLTFSSDVRIVYISLVNIKKKVLKLNRSSSFNLIIYRLLIENYYFNMCNHNEKK